MALPSVPKTTTLVRRIFYNANMSSNGSGLISISLDLSALLASTTAWTNTIVLFERASVPRIYFTVMPLLYFSGTAPALIGNAVLYYDSTSSAVAASLPAAMNHNSAVLMTSLNDRVNFNFKPFNLLGINTPIIYTDYVAGFLGYLNILGTNWPVSTASLSILISFDVHFSYIQ